VKIHRYHEWTVSPSDAAVIQKEMAAKVRREPLSKKPRFIAGADISYDIGSNQHLAAVILLSFPDLQVLEEVSTGGQVDFPYIPGYLSFREVPLLAQAFLKLKQEPDLIICDGQGIAHPRRIGLATHLGLILDMPTIGAAKSLLCGRFVEPGKKRGSISPIIHKEEEIGVALRTKDNVSPLIVSLGHRITLEESIRYVLASATRYRMPEPTRLAHNFANKIRREKSSWGKAPIKNPQLP
jgi:deoxyribonuclease V